MKGKTITPKDLKKLVIEEATKLKQTATTAELKNLNFKKLNPSEQHSCIYGQMTGDCFNTRAEDLIIDCCKEVITGTLINMSECNESYGLPTKRRNRLWTPVYYSPIEVFITQSQNKENGNNKALIDYLKGKTKTLKLK